MRILMVTASLPYPPASGGALRTYGILRGLHEAGHKITLLSFHDGEISPEATPLANYCQSIHTLPPPQRTSKDRLRDLLLSNEPDIAKRLYSDAFSWQLRAMLAENNYDLVQFEGIEIAPYLPLIRQHTQARLCYDAFNAEAELQRIIFHIDRKEMRRWPAALYSRMQVGRIARFEKQLCQTADLVLAVSQEDAAILQTMSNGKPLHIVPNGIFTEQYTETTSSVTLGEYAIVFTGKMDYRPNVDAMLWFTEEILPLIRNKVPQATLTIVGQKPHPRLSALQKQKHITITGWVESVKPYLKAAKVYVAPLRMGSGTRLKILEAMASECAVVATSTAAAGLNAELKSALVLADRAQDVAQSTVRLLQNPEHRQTLGRNAQIAVRKHYDWSALIPRLIAAYKDIGLE